jgi:hypothetical protein
MTVEVITNEDLQALRLQLISDIKELLLPKHPAPKDWLRSAELIYLVGSEKLN